ncbi:hypothetical protein HAX54_043938 [Datura stramonium]|uniref:Uncharacterized protein n=1 Tax=Datura stramonium TaxID=4076 RepID=A0ABS8W5E0_DATST|nr:hypothetical protein [Datura stramonium]
MTTTTGKITSEGNKKQHEAASWKDIGKRQLLRDESESDSSSGSESEEGGAEVESDGKHPPANNAEEGNDDVEELGDDDSEAEESGLALNEKGNTSRSIQEEPKIQINVLNEVQKLKRFFDYNMYWMAKTLGKYNMEMVLDISERTITRVLMGGDYKVLTQTTEYDYQIEAMKGIKKLSTKDKVIHFQWMENIIAKDMEGAE